MRDGPDKAFPPFVLFQYTGPVRFFKQGESL